MTWGQERLAIWNPKAHMVRLDEKRLANFFKLRRAETSNAPKPPRTKDEHAVGYVHCFDERGLIVDLTHEPAIVRFLDARPEARWKVLWNSELSWVEERPSEEAPAGRTPPEEDGDRDFRLRPWLIAKFPLGGAIPQDQDEEELLVSTQDSSVGVRIGETFWKLPLGDEMVKELLEDCRGRLEKGKRSPVR